MLHLTLSPDERATIEALIAHTPKDIPVKRLQIVLLAAQGMKAPEIATEIDMHPINVRKWMHRYVAKGLDGLRNQGKAPGRPRTLTPEQRAEIASLYASNPRALGYEFTHWSLKRIKEHLIATGIVKSISVQTINKCVNEGAKNGWTL